MSLTNFLAVKGLTPKGQEMANWKEEHFLEFFKIVNHFTIQEGSSQVVKVTMDKVKALEDAVFHGESPNNVQAEFLYRIDNFHKEPMTNQKSYYNRLAVMMRVIGKYVKENPSTITDAIYNVCYKNDRINWCLRNFKTVSTRLGDVVVPETQETVSFSPRKVPSADPQVKLLDSITYLADAYMTIAKSLKKSDLRDMDVKDKIAALSKLSFILEMARKPRPSIGVLNQININKANKESVEEALLNFSKK